MPQPARGARAESKPLPRNAAEMVALGRDFLARNGREEARLEAEHLVAHAMGCDRLRLYLALERPVERGEIERARELLVQRAQGVPVAYLTGVREFYGRPFQVGPGCLVPRPETELLIDLAREWAGLRAEEAAAPVVGEFGTGSGCLAVTLALELEAQVHASELSADALGWARANGEKLGAAVDWIEADGLAALLQSAPEGFDLLVSNPPYIDPEQPAGLEPDVRAHEPAQALFSPAGDPDHWVRQLLERGAPCLREGGELLVELGLGQGERVAQLARSHGLEAELRDDLAGIPRVLRCRRAL